MISLSSPTRRPRAAGVLASALAALALCVCAPTAAPAAPTQPQQAKEAIIVSKQALAYYYKGRHDMAAELYRRAYELDPNRPEYLYGAARAEHKRGALKAAMSLYDKVIAQAGSGHQLAVKSSHHKSAAQAALAAQAKPPVKPKVAAPVKAAAKQAAVVTKSAPTADWRPVAGWSAMAGGAVFGAVGLTVLLGAVADNDALDELFDSHSEGKPITSMKYADAVKERESANGRVVIGWTLTGVGLAAAGVGAWLVATAPAGDGAVLLPRVDGRGVRLCVRF